MFDGNITVITFQDIEKLKQPRQSYLDILLFNEEDVKNKIKDSKPVARVFFTRLESKYKYYTNFVIPDLESVEHDEVIIEEKYLYDLSDLGKAMCLAVGRYSHNHFRPFLNDQKIDMDPFVSREHGLIFLNEKKEVCYHDIGTFKKGSTNGTKLNDVSIVKDDIIIWSPSDYFGLGECLNIIKNNERIIESKFKLRYHYIDEY